MRYVSRSLAIATLLLSSLAARAETIGCTVISPPAKIDKPGVYCLDRDHKVALASGQAIWISSNNVVLDFNGHAIINSVEPDNRAYGIYAAGGWYVMGLSNVTVRNGRLVGFGERGIYLGGTLAASAHLVENMSVEWGAGDGIVVDGWGSVVRGNRVVGRGRYGTAAASSRATRGIALGYSSGVAIDNDVSQIYGAPAVGIEVDGDAMFVARNRIKDLTTVSGSGEYGIRAKGTAIVRDNSIIDNAPTADAQTYGVWASRDSVKIVGNVVDVVGTAYIGTLLPGSGNQ